MVEKKKVLITNKATGETRFGEHVPGIVSRRQDGATPEEASEAEPNSSLMPSEAKRSFETDGQPATKQSSSISGKKKPAEKTGSKQDKVQSLADYIAYAYGRKGQKLAELKDGQIRSFAKNFKLAEREAELLSIAEKDVTLAVPRQLLFIIREFHVYPMLRSELLGFVKKAILRHPLFSEQPELTLFINQGDGCPSAIDAMRLIYAFGTANESKALELNRTELDALRRNAAYLLAVWLKEMRGRSLHDVAEMLFQGVWMSAAASQKDETDKLRAMTEISELAPVAIACSVFRQQAEEQTRRANQSASEALQLRQERDSLRAEKEGLGAELSALRDLLESERKVTQERLAKLESTQDVKVTHLRDDNQQVRHRLVKRLVSDVEQLEIGLSALRNPNPRVEVMMQRAERVVDALRAEIAKLREE